MKRLIVLSCLLLGFVPVATADHITGGEISYTFSGVANGSYRYTVMVKMFMRCNSGRQFNNPTILSVFNRSTNSRVRDLSIPLSRTETLQLTDVNLCITNPPQVCYEVGYYEAELSLPAVSGGYLLAAQVVYRVDGMNNLIPNYNQVGALYTSIIPSSGAVRGAAENSSARFTGNDLVVVCAQNAFTYDFSATDADGDELRYSFCNAYQSSGVGPGNSSTPPPSPPFPSVPYGNLYSGSTPLGNNVRIDPVTGEISGIAPPPGTYVVNVCVEEIRQGVVIATQHKDLQITITSCSIAAAALLPEYSLCGEGWELSLANLSTSPLIETYSWKILDRNDIPIISAGDPTLRYTFSDTGTYRIQLSINENRQCADSTSALVRVYPGLQASFSISGSCLSKTIQFNDSSFTAYGTLNGWNWDFGEQGAADDFSFTRNAAYVYPQPGLKSVQLVVTNTMGCRDTATRTLTAPEDINASAGRDTNIVAGQRLQLQASGGTRYLWSPATGLSATDIADPVAFFSSSGSQRTYTYKVTVFNDVGCMDSAFIRVNVFQSMPDVFVPSAFTPNGDGLNDFFAPVGAGIQQIDVFRIYNRWGQLVYSAAATHSSGWDGSVNGTPEPSGTFVWFLKAVDYTGRPVVKKGTVTLIR